MLMIKISSLLRRYIFTQRVTIVDKVNKKNTILSTLISLSFESVGKIMN